VLHDVFHNIDEVNLKNLFYLTIIHENNQLKFSNNVNRRSVYDIYRLTRLTVIGVSEIRLIANVVHLYQTAHRTLVVSSFRLLKEEWCHVLSAAVQGLFRFLNL
jgi:hypothetical protein